MKTKQLRLKTNEELMEMLRRIEMEQIKAGSAWQTAKKSLKDIGVKVTTKGTPTSLQKDLRRNRARILTILNERGIKDGIIGSIIN